MYRKFLEFSNTLIGYFYNNLSCPYHVVDAGPSSVQSTLSKKAQKLSSERNREVLKTGFCDRSKLKNKNRISKYIASNGIVSTSYFDKGTTPGDLNADEYNSFYLGRHTIRNGDRPQKYSRSPDPFVNFYHRNKEVFDKYDIKVDKSIVMNGCFKSNKATLQKTMTPDFPNRFSAHPTMALIKERKVAHKTAIRKLNITTLPKCERDDMLLSNFNLETYPGFTQKEVLGCENKRKSVDISYNVAKTRWDNITKATSENRVIKRNELFPSTYVVGARNKKDCYYEDGDEVTSRAVHMPEFHCEMQVAPWIDGISTHIKESKSGPIYIGNSFVEFQRLEKDLAKTVTSVEGDVKRFDSRLYLIKKVEATALARLYYDIDDKEIDNHFVAIFDSISILDYYTPGGFIYRLIHGLPSGVKSTSLFGSFINFIDLLHSCRFINLKRLKLSIGGDDFLLHFEVKLEDGDLDKIKDNSYDVGIEFKILSFKNKDSPDSSERPCFYKYTIDKGEPVVPIGALLERVFIPSTREYKNDGEILSFLFDVMPSLAAPRSHLYLFYLFFSEMYNRVVGTIITVGDVYGLHSSMYSKVIKKEILPYKPTGSTECLTFSRGLIEGRPLSIDLNNYFVQNYDRRKVLIPKFRRKGKMVKDLTQPFDL